ncbi:Ribose-5-phosphate isomerase A [Astathelohania contejeani]|uniref:Ribose-5-phosphate isomerase n=1 Tax=Astathelohania contejeani TaxID=164912 RepID=A0ABQ7HYY8_9MICR|nr:Ribose-5-phosphate isomerase A [Thelohania contejeani]
MNQIFLKYYADQEFVGIGTGKTIKDFITHIPIKETKFIFTSHQSCFALKDFLTIPIYNAPPQIPLYFDGADYFDGVGNVIKGGGGSLTQEKILASMSELTVILVQEHKYRETFVGCIVPIEIIPQSMVYVMSILKKRNIKYKLRTSEGKCGPVITDLGNFIIDIEYDYDFIKECKMITGVVEHGLFLQKDFNMKIEIIK